MAEYIDREAVKEYLLRCADGYQYIETPTQSAIDAIYKIPVANVRHVVRCKDCKHSYDAIGGLFCSHGVCVDCAVNEDFYCADGE